LSKDTPGFSIVVLAWTNGNITIRISYKCWFRKEAVGKDQYESKSEKAEQLILEISESGN